MGSSKLEALKIEWYNLAIKGEPIIGKNKKLFDSLPFYAQEELKKAYLSGVNDETETWMTTPVTATTKVLF